MELYKKRLQTYAAQSSDQLLRQLLCIFEEIPSRVQQYPQMRKDIKQFLEEQSDNGHRALFELSARIAKLESEGQAARAPSRTASSDGHEDVLKRLEEMEAALTERIKQMEQTIQEDLQGLEVSADERNSDLLGGIGDRLEETRAAIDHTTVEVGKEFGSQMYDHFKSLVGGIAEDVVAAKNEIAEATKGLMSANQAPVPVLKTYASAAATKPAHRPALHSVAVTLEGGEETADEVLSRVKKAVDARGTGLKISKVRKAKNQTVILGCDTEEERNKVQKIIEKRGNGLKVTPMQNKNPLVILKDIYIDSEDQDLITALYAQNKEVFEGLSEEEIKVDIKFKKRTRNPKTVHIILQVRPSVWRRMTEAGALYLDLQRVRVEDQSPLIQCTRCLAFGHGRKFCTEGADRCSHCGGPHLRERCADLTAGNEPRCCNCSHSGLQKTDHNAFSVDCPVRKKWDYLARANTAYA
ncbi:unnamed protein product [Arctia plantaginis]|uniref:Uncharacterized protein n=1 Tax=Arctia plantaginis TaxID=874455 RepID=A0A8S1B259_ARCPL|nr:unnamed protein product [Arctia plantaginis]